MEESVHQNNIDNVLVEPEKNNVNVEEVEEFNYPKWLKDQVLAKVSAHKLDHIQDFLYGEGIFMGGQSPYVNIALKKMTKFMYYWLIELDDYTRKLIINNKLNGTENAYIPYKEFLKTPLWKYESSLLKVILGFTCERCKERFHPECLVVHHLSYEHLGSELNYLDEVQLLCTKCHAEIHGKVGSDD